MFELRLVLVSLFKSGKGHAFKFLVGRIECLVVVRALTRLCELLQTYYAVKFLRHQLEEGPCSFLVFQKHLLPKALEARNCVESVQAH